ncbi:MAG TPA: hypothetical protein VMN39_12265, partial [Longimicrobiaceae bacterium]|nr:hypothetical protein [Longimicrobiaceae bacterium]
TSEGITLSAVGRKVKGLQKADLSWSPTGGSENVDVYRDGAWRATTANNGSYTDPIDLRGGGTYLYRVCLSPGTTTCSNTVTVVF